MAHDRRWYEAEIGKMSEKPCGAIPVRTVRECNPPSQNNYRCGICNRKLYKADTDEDS